MGLSNKRIISFPSVFKRDPGTLINSSNSTANLFIACQDSIVEIDKYLIDNSDTIS